jgi:hypothetical protein
MSAESPTENLTEPFPDFDPNYPATSEMFTDFTMSEPVTIPPIEEEDLDVIIARLSAITSAAGFPPKGEDIVKPSQLLAQLCTSLSTAASPMPAAAENAVPAATSSAPPPPTNAESQSKDSFGESLLSPPKGQAPSFPEQDFEEASRLDDDAKTPKIIVTEPDQETSFTSGPEARTRLAQLENKTSTTSDTDSKRMLPEREEQTSDPSDNNLYQARFLQHQTVAPYFLDQILAASWAPNDDGEDPKKMLAEFGEQTSYTDNTDTDIDSKKMLADFGEETSYTDDTDTDPKAMLAELERGALHGGYDSNDVEDSEAETQACVKQATEELDKLIAYTVEQEKRHKLIRRVIVSNIAIDASVEDLKEFFCGHTLAM